MPFTVAVIAVVPEPETSCESVIVWFAVRKADVQPPSAPTAEMVVGAAFAEQGLVEPPYPMILPLESAK